jgi:hypothetical protein
MATLSFRFMPPESAWLCTFTFSTSPTSAMILLTAASTCHDDTARTHGEAND